LIQYYAIRASGITALVLFTITVVLGLMDRSRLTSDGWPRFVIDRLHRNVSLLATVFLVIHVVTSVTDGFVDVPVLSAFIAFSHSYSTFWLGMGALSWDLMLAVLITSLLRARLGHASWRVVHWLAYAAWPIAVIHGIGEGTDTPTIWMWTINACCIGAVIAALAVRLITVPRLKTV
jgi:sulfoxide reductase heme-binding subunit YedZ